MRVMYSRKGGLSDPSLNRMQSTTTSEEGEESVPAFALRRTKDGSINVLMLALPIKEVEERLVLDLGNVVLNRAAST